MTLVKKGKTARIKIASKLTLVLQCFNLMPLNNLLPRPNHQYPTRLITLAPFHVVLAPLALDQVVHSLIPRVIISKLLHHVVSELHAPVQVVNSSILKEGFYLQPSTGGWQQPVG
jgi:hypothetical protein